MKAVRTVLTVGLVLLPTLAVAYPAMVKDFQSTYNIQKKSTLGKAKCAVCHVGSTAKLNPYGADIHKAVGEKSRLTAADLKKVEGMDSDKDGISNIDEIKGDSLPGSAASPKGK